VARSATGVVRVVAIPLLIWHSVTARTTPAVAYGRGFPSLSKPYPRRGALRAEFRDRNWTRPAIRQSSATGDDDPTRAFHQGSTAKPLVKARRT